MDNAYQPSNGTEGQEFTQRWCENCERDRAYQEWLGSGDDDHNKPDSCPILCAALLFSIGEPDYPKEWIHDEGDPRGPRCTAFEEARTEQDDPTVPNAAIPRCDKTADMFADEPLTIPAFLRRGND